MKIDINDLLDHSFVISIDPTRLSIFTDRFTTYQLNTPLPKYFYGYPLPTINIDNTTKLSLSHASIIRTAKAFNWPFVCIFEDDAYPSKTIIQDLAYYLTDIPDDIDVLKLGWSITTDKRIEKITDKIDRRITYGAHSYIVFNKYYDAYLHRFNKRPKADDYVINSWCYNIYTTNKCLFIQLNSENTKQINAFKSKQYLVKHIKDQLQYFDLPFTY